MSLAVKYRPLVWSDMVGQRVPVKILSRMVSSGDVHPFIIFYGPRGSGKTSAARIFARSLNCLDLQDDQSPCNSCRVCLAILSGTCPDVIEQDAASNRGVDSIRHLRNLANYVTAMANNRVFILDEGHALTSDATTALLKILEEPPPNTYFLLATTEFDSLLDTVISRSYPLGFVLLNITDIVSRLSFISGNEGISISKEALHQLARMSSGGMRDAITHLQQASYLSDSSEITFDLVNEMLGYLTFELLLEMVTAILNNRRIPLLKIFRDLMSKGITPSSVVQGLIDYCSTLYTLKYNLDVDLPDSLKNEVVVHLSLLRMNLDTFSRLVLTLDSSMNHSFTRKDALLEIHLMTLCSDVSELMQ
jgi:DNA polymerase-3 subunit gamma/tau